MQIGRIRQVSRQSFLGFCFARRPSWPVTAMTRAASGDPQPRRRGSWFEDAAVQRGYIKPGDFAQFGCLAGWMGIHKTAAALRGHAVSTTYMGAEPPPHEGTITCVSQESSHSRRSPHQHILEQIWSDAR